MIVKIKIEDTLSIIDMVKNLNFNNEELILSRLNEEIRIPTNSVVSYTVYTDTGSIIEDTELSL